METTKVMFKKSENPKENKNDEKKVHELKTLMTYFELTKRGLKPFEFRKDDRNFKEGDFLLLIEVALVNNSEGDTIMKYTGRKLLREITYKLTEFDGMEEGYCVLGLRDVLVS